MPVKMDGYIRVSQVAGRAGERFQSPDQQRDTILAWAKANGVQIAEWHEDLDRSGGTMDRPGMNRVRERIAAGEISGVVVARMDRFARTVIGGLTTIEELHAQGARVVSVAESIDPATPIGRAMLGLVLVMAAWQRDQADDYLGQAQARAASAGRFPGRPAYGYRRDEHGRTIVDERAARAVRLIFEKRAGGQGWRTIARDLSRSDYVTSTGRGEWAETTILGIVRSEAYVGVFVGPRGLRVEDAWEPLVARDVWQAANRVAGVQNDARRYHDMLVAGIARCASCRRVLHRAHNPQGYVSYACPNKSCGRKVSIGGTILDEHVRALVDERLAGIALSGRVADEGGEGERLTTAREAAERELEAWRDDVEMRGVLGDMDWRAGMLARAKARDAAEVELAQHRAVSGLSEVAVAPDGGVTRLADLPWDLQRGVVQRWVHSVWVRKSPVVGPGARRLVDQRARLVWQDDPVRPAFPSVAAEAEGPVSWE